MKEFVVKKYLFAVAILLISSKQILACDYYEDEKVLKETINTGVYKSNVTGKVCSHDKKSFIPIKNGKADGKAKVFLLTEPQDGKAKVFLGLPDASKGIMEVEFKNGKREGLFKRYYLSGALLAEANYKNDKLEGLTKIYYESGKLKEEGNYKDNKLVGLWKYYDESGALKAETMFSKW